MTTAGSPIGFVLLFTAFTAIILMLAWLISTFARKRADRSAGAAETPASRTPLSPAEISAQTRRRWLLLCLFVPIQLALLAYTLAHIESEKTFKVMLFAVAVVQLVWIRLSPRRSA